MKVDSAVSAELSAQSVSKHFTGIRAVDEVTLPLRTGEIHGLIGPNGSGKTTFLNLLSGYYRIDEGAVLLDGRDISSATVQKRASLGIARTFQIPKLLPELTVLDNVMLGGWPGSRATFLETAFALPRPRREEAEIRRRAAAILEGIGLDQVSGRRTQLLDHASQRFLEIARALTMAPRFLLLDEPAAGLTLAEIDRLADIVGVIRNAGIGVLIVEHHTDFVFRISDRVTAFNLGKVIAQGPADVVSQDPEVIRVYLGA